MLDEYMSISEVVKTVEEKKNCHIENLKVFIQTCNQDRISCTPEDILHNFGDIEKLHLTGRLYSSQYPEGFDSELNTHNLHIETKAKKNRWRSASSASSVSNSDKRDGTLKRIMTKLLKSPKDEGNTSLSPHDLILSKPPSIRNSIGPSIRMESTGEQRESLSKLSVHKSLRNSQLSPVLSRVFSNLSLDVTSREASGTLTAPECIESGPFSEAAKMDDSSNLDVKVSHDGNVNYEEDDVESKSPAEPTEGPSEAQILAMQRKRHSFTGLRGRSKATPIDTVLQFMESRKVLPMNGAGEGFKMVLFKLHSLDGTSTVLKMAGNLQMDQVCRNVCTNRNLDYTAFTFDTGDKANPTAVEMDRALESFSSVGAIMPEFYLVKRAKLYNPRVVNDDNNEEVLSYFVVEGVIQVMLATPEKIVDILTDITRDLDREFTQLILLTFQNYTTIESFMDELIMRFENPSMVIMCPFNSTLKPASEEDKCNAKNRILSILDHWVENVWPHFGLSTASRDKLYQFLEKLEADKSSDFCHLAKRILTLAESQRSDYDALLESYNMRELNGNQSKYSSKGMFEKLDLVDIAQQLCIYHYKMFKNIHQVEFLNEFWKRNNESSPAFRWCVARFDVESYWVATELIEAQDSKTRVKTMAKFINLISECIRLNNFFSAFSIISGLNLTPVQRLKKTWEALPQKSKKEWEEVSKLADPSKNMKNYRDLLAQTVPPMIPFLPIYLKDLTFLNDGNQSKIRGLINVDKLRTMMGKVIEITNLADYPYLFSSLPPVLHYVTKPHVSRNHEELMKKAAAIELQ